MNGTCTCEAALLCAIIFAPVLIFLSNE